MLPCFLLFELSKSWMAPPPLGFGGSFEDFSFHHGVRSDRYRWGLDDPHRVRRLRGAQRPALIHSVGIIRRELALPENASIRDTIRDANALLGLTSTDSLVAQADRVLAELLPR